MTDFIDIENLSAGARRGIIRNQLPALILQGLNQQRALEFFRDRGLGIRVQDFRSIYREVALEEEQANRVQFVGRDRNITDSVLSPSRRDIPEQYRLIFKVPFRDTLSNENFDRWFVLDTDRLGIRSDLEREAEGFFQSLYGQFEVVAGGARLLKGYTRPEGGLL